MWLTVFHLNSHPIWKLSIRSFFLFFLSFSLFFLSYVMPRERYNMSLPTPSKDPFEEPSFLSTFLPTIFHTTISPYHFFRFNFVPFFIHVRILSSVFFNFFKFLSLAIFFVSKLLSFLICQTTLKKGTKVLLYFCLSADN